MSLPGIHINHICELQITQTTSQTEILVYSQLGAFFCLSHICVLATDHVSVQGIVNIDLKDGGEKDN